MNQYFKDKTAAVTGGASGIGLALVEAMLEMGAGAVTIADINEANLAKHVERLSGQHPGRVQGVKTDVTQEESVASMVKRAASFGQGRLDLLFNNAGLGLSGAFEDLTNDDWSKAFAINFYGALYGIRAALPIMKEAKSGHICNTASGIAFVNFPLQTMYASTKAALLGLTNSLRYEYWDDGIRFSTIIPGTVATAIWEGAGKIPDFAITPEECAASVLQGVIENRRVIFVTEADRSGCVNMALGAAYMPSIEEQVQNYLLGVARARKKGDFTSI
jgi:NAD(P)-dependent dehydrogenase (short-subunit alcohol dehydrogenase family)